MFFGRTISALVTIFLLNLVFVSSPMACHIFSRSPAMGQIHLDNFTQFSPRDQVDFVYSQVLESEYRNKPGLILNGIWGTLKGSLNLLLAKRLRQTLRAKGIELPESRARNKMIHTFGSVAKGRIVLENGEELPVIIRASYAGPPLWLGPIPIIGNVPGVALMIFRKGEPPINMFLMHGLDSQSKNTSIFERDLLNILPNPKSPIMKFITFLFEKVVYKGQGLSQTPEGISRIFDLASFDSELRTAVEWEFSYGQLVLTAKPPQKLRDLDTRNDFRDDLAELEIGTHLWDLVAVPTPMSSRREDSLIGSIVLDSQFIASEFGDKVLFFRHNDHHLRHRDRQN